MTKSQYFEMGHTASIFSDMVYAHLTEPYSDETLRKKRLQASELLAEIYQEAMAKSG